MKCQFLLVAFAMVMEAAGAPIEEKSPNELYDSLGSLVTPSNIYAISKRYIKEDPPKNATEFQFGVQAIPTEKRVIRLNSVSDLKLKKNLKLMKDTNNVLFFQSTKTTLFYEENDRAWQEMKFEDTNQQLTPRFFENAIPVTGCILATSGASGSIKQEYSVTVGVSKNLGAIFSHGILPMVTASYGHGKIVNPTLTYTDSIMCSLVSGQSVQMFIQPLYLDFPGYTTRQVSFKKSLGLKFSDLFQRHSKLRLLEGSQPNHVCKYYESNEVSACAAAETVHYYGEDCD